MPISWTYAYSPGLLPAFITAVLIAIMGWYARHKHNAPGAKPFALFCLFGTLWAIGALLETAAVDSSTKLFWFRFQAAWQLPTATSLLCFVLDYAGFGRWLTRRTLAFLSIVPVLAVLLIVTNDYHRLIWTGFRMAGSVDQSLGAANWILLGYAFALAVADITVLAWLAISVPYRRWPVTVMLLGQLVGLGLYLLGDVQPSFFGDGERVFVVLGPLCAASAFAFSRFHFLDPVPAAHDAAIAQMLDAMIVLDWQGRVVDLNGTAERILGKPLSVLLGHSAADFLPDQVGLTRQDKTTVVQSELSLPAGNSTRHYSAYLTPLRSDAGDLLGQMLLLHDVTEQKEAQAKIVEQQRAMATLEERERLAREFHDGIGQTMAYVGIQAHVIRELMKGGNIDRAESQLIRLEKAARDAQTDLRESILSLKACSASGWSFFPTLERYLDDFQSQYGIRTEFIAPDSARDGLFEPGVEVQLLRVVQEALTNARRHSGAKSVRISFELTGSRAVVKITDDGSGFDPGLSNPDGGMHFGLVFMRERMTDIGGSFEVESRPGAGTIIKLVAPRRSGREGAQ